MKNAMLILFLLVAVVTHAQTSGGVTQTATASSCTLSKVQFAKEKSTIEKQTLPAAKERMAKQLGESKCLSVAQIREVALLFDTDEERLNVFKASYENCTDKPNFEKLKELVKEMEADAIKFIEKGNNAVPKEEKKEEIKKD